MLQPVGGTEVWLRQNHISYSDASGFRTKAIHWRSNQHHRKNIDNHYPSNLNGKLRNTRIPIYNWRTADKRYFHWKWGYKKDTDEWYLEYNEENNES